MSAPDVTALRSDGPPGPEQSSRRVAEARRRGAERLQRQRRTLRPLGWALAVAVLAGTLGGHPQPSAHGTGLAVLAALATFLGTLAVTIRDPFVQLARHLQAATIAGMGAAGVALVALQPRGATTLAAGAAVWMAVARLPGPPGIAIAAAVTAALALAIALTGGSAAALLASTLLCALLAVVAQLMRQARESQDRTELLLAELEDAREEQTRAAALAERGRIAGELHDVLAHSLSGAAIQLQAARKLAERDGAGEPTRGAIDRAGELVRDGLADARQAVGALRGERLPGVADLRALVAGFERDLRLDVTLEVTGAARPLGDQAGLALYRGAQEALTNVARHAPGARTVVRLAYGAERATLSVEDELPDAMRAAVAELAGVGGGRGLAGMRERAEHAGGSVLAGPTASGWRVELEVPA